MACLDAPPYDIVLFVLDDMRADQLPALEQTLARLDPTSVAFDRAYVTTPMCCPERASFLSGGWLPQSTGVITNTAPLGGATAFYDGDTLATRLQAQGYTTALVGKYLNQYIKLGDYVPPGWTFWGATYGADGWEDFNTMGGSSTPEAPAVGELTARSGYLTDWEGEEALRIWQQSAEAPLFLYLSFDAPHDPHTPAPQDLSAFPDFLFRGGAYEEEDLSDKPEWLQRIPKMSLAEEAARDRHNRQRQQTLLAADRAMAALIDAVMASPRAERTVFVLTSDNGLMWREHRLTEKGVAYEEAVRVPLLISAPELASGHRAGLVAMNLDLAATVQALAGLDAYGEGLSLLPSLCQGQEPPRDALLLQAWNAPGGSWAAVVTATDKLILGENGGVELYDLVNDPYEMSSLHADEDQADRLEELRDRLAEGRGLAITVTTLPEARVGQPYAEALSAEGGEAPLVWSLIGDPPPGLFLDSAGTLRGTPTAPGRYTLEVRVNDSGRSPVYGGPQRFRTELILVVREGGCGAGRASILGLLLGLGRRRRIS